VDVGDACAAALATQGTQKVYKHARRRDDEEEDEEDDDEEEDDTEGVLNDDLKVAEPAGGSSAYSASGGSPSPAVSAYSASRSKTSRETVSGLAARVGVGGLLAVLPDPTQAFRDARFRQAQRVDLAPGASLALVDWTVSGRAAFEGGGAGGFTSGRGGGLAPADDPTLRVDGGERWRFASFATRTEVTARGGEVDVLVESSRLERRDPWPGGAGEEALRLRMGDAHALATAVLVGPRTAEARARAREVAAPLVAATVRGGARGTRGGGAAFPRGERRTRGRTRRGGEGDRAAAEEEGVVDIRLRLGGARAGRGGRAPGRARRARRRAEHRRVLRAAARDARAARGGTRRAALRGEGPELRGKGDADADAAIEKGERGERAVRVKGDAPSVRRTRILRM
jgi:hypothetical protein